MEKRAYTVKEFIEAYCISHNHFYENFRNNSAFPLLKLGRKVLILKDEADEFMRQLAYNR